ncbi:hypothetical protein [Actinomadura rudentiformis]|uniref:Uncharacterized protein n=1 Tax=Actinomadura rudentiformis TaxID=359158 RepID=A0A6H9YZN0_9ACTN|nr:hypothetical protein [Actinomadura rudentiformis]KAB2350847.1 hypothetical protein F8566_07745 [Actinomadura rudentiformis]
MSSPAPPPPPGPEGAESWTEFTARLRALYEWCDSPKYRTLTSRVTGLSPAAISNLIGRNPLVRPPETACVRFVEACLTYRGHPDPEGELARWKAQWDALSEQQANAIGSPSPPTEPEPSGAAVPQSPPPHEQAQAPDPTVVTVPSLGQIPPERRRPAVHPFALAGVAALVVLAAVAVIVVLTGRDDAPGAHGGATAGPDAKPVGNPTGGTNEICRPLVNTVQSDTRQKRLWKKVFQCANHPNSALYEHPREGPKISFMYTKNSWFVCWARGEKHSGGNDIWYYTQGDRSADKPELDAWGFMPASQLVTTKHPNPGVERECPFS